MWVTVTASALRAGEERPRVWGEDGPRYAWGKANMAFQHGDPSLHQTAVTFRNHTSNMTTVLWRFYFCTTVTLLDSRWSNTCSCVHNDDVSKCSLLKNTVDLTKQENSFGYFEQINKDTSSRRSAWRQRNAALWICCCDDHFNNYFKEPKLLQ